MKSVVLKGSDIGTEIRVPENVTIVTACNSEKAMLIEQLKGNGIPFLNAAKKRGSWNNLKKIGYINTSLFNRLISLGRTNM
jgi:hypothetical protein